MVDYFIAHVRYVKLSIGYVEITTEYIAIPTRTWISQAFSLIFVRIPGTLLETEQSSSQERVIWCRQQQ